MLSLSSELELLCAMEKAPPRYSFQLAETQPLTNHPTTPLPSSHKITLRSLFYHPREQLRKAVISAFAIDMQYLEHIIPPNTPEVYVYGAHGWAPDHPRFHLGHPPKSTLSRELQHAKVGVLFFETFCRVYVTSSNLMVISPVLYQSIWYQDFSKRKELLAETGNGNRKRKRGSNTNSNARTPSSNYSTMAEDFCETLTDLFQYLGHTGDPEFDMLPSTYDFDQVKIVLITSIPGYYSPDDQRYGLAKLQYVVSKRVTVTPESHLIFQSSSLGNVGNIATQLGAACGVTNMRHIRVLWPSQEGKPPGFPLFFRRQEVQRALNAPDNQNILRTFVSWDSRGSNSNSNSYASSYAHTLPHIKTIACFEGDPTTNPRLLYAVTGSHNTSQSAWGLRLKDGRLKIANAEASVLVLGDETVHLMASADYSGMYAKSDGTVCVDVPLPFQFDRVFQDNAFVGKPYDREFSNFE